MTAAGLPSAQALLVWRKRFPDLQNLWAGHARVWHVELAVRESTGKSHLAKWLDSARNLGATSFAELPGRFGLPENVVASTLENMNRGNLVRRSFAYLDLPRLPIPIPPNAEYSSWPHPVNPAEVPLSILKPPGIEAVATTTDWRTIPVIRAEGMSIVGVRRVDQIEVYSSMEDRLGETPLTCLPPDQLPYADAQAWTKAWDDWRAANSIGREVRLLSVHAGVARAQGGDSKSSERACLWAGDGPIREGAAIEFK